jgi:hypothetical protein
MSPYVAKIYTRGMAFLRGTVCRELEAVGLRLNKKPPEIYFKKKKMGGITFNSTVR